MASNLQGLTTRLHDEADPVGSGGGKEEQLKKIKESTSPLSITRVDGESVGKILSAATDNLSKDLEKFSEQEHKMMVELVKEIGKLTEKNLEGFNKGIKEVIELAKKGQALAEKSGNTEGAKRFSDTAKAAKDEYFKANDMGLRGNEDTFKNRLSRAFSGKDTKTGTAVPKGFLKTQLEGAKRVFTGKPGDLRYSVFTNDAKKRSEARDAQGWAQEAEKLSDLTKDQKKMLADKGIAPASDKDISYRKDGKPVSLKDINAELEKDYNEKKNATAIIPEDKAKPDQVAASIESASDAGSPASALQEEAAGIQQDPVVNAIEDQTKKLDEISDTLSQANELFDAIKTTIEKIATSIEGIESDSGSSGGGSIIDNVMDVADDLTGGSNGSGSKKSRSERAKSQPRDAKGRFVKKEAGVAKKGFFSKLKGKKGILGGLGLAAGAVGIGAAMSDDSDEPSTADVVANTATTATDLADVGTKSAEKTEAKVAEKGAAKAGEKAAVKAGEKVAAKGVAKVGAKAVGKSLLKKIPGVSILAGGAFAAQRAMQGDWLGAGGELLSGVAGTIPGVGTAASVGIDAALAARDMGALGGTPETRAAEQAASGAAPAPAKPAAVQGKPGGGILSKAAGFVKKNPLMAAAGLGGIGLAAVGASKAWDYFSGGNEEAKVQSGQNPDSGILEKGSEDARDKMNVSVPAPTIINQGGSASTPEKSTTPNTKTYVRDDESSWMRFALKRAMA